MEQAPSISKKALFGIIVAAVGASLIAGILGALIVVFFEGGFGDFSDSNQYDTAACNVATLEIHGEIVSTRADIPLSDTVQMQEHDGSTYLAAPGYAVATDIENQLAGYASDPSIKGVLIDIDSPGGSAEAGSELAAAIRAFGKPSVSLIRDLGASSGYLSASAANYIVASPDSTVGSIGATESYVDQSKYDQQSGSRSTL